MSNLKERLDAAGFRRVKNSEEGSCSGCEYQALHGANDYCKKLNFEFTPPNEAYEFICNYYELRNFEKITF